MSFIKRAFLYVTRKWKQSIIVFLILLAVCTSALVGLSILKASDTAAANLRGQFGGTFSLGIDISNPANMHSAGSTDRYTGRLMLALGESRGTVLVQRITEIALVAVLAFGLSYPASGMAANNIGNMLLTQANEQIIPESPSNTIQAGMPITSDDFDLSPVFASPKVEELTVTVSINIFMAVYGLGLLIVLLSVCAASVPAMRMNPNEILSKMD